MASQAVLAPDAAITSAVMILPALGAPDCSIAERAPPQPAAPSSASHATLDGVPKRRRGRNPPRPLSLTSFTRDPSIHDRIRHHVLHRVHRLAIHPYLVVQVRTGGEAGRADERDLLPAFHALPAHHED